MKETWMHTMWRPAIAWSYLVICLFDFLVAPIINAIFYAVIYPDQPFAPWQPITLSEGGLYHMAMLTIVGVTAWSRGQEKMKFFDFFANNSEPDDMEEEKVVKKTVKKVTK